jgi:hypothetical protein
MRHPEKLHLTVNGKVWRVNAYIYIYIRLYIKAKNIVIRFCHDITEILLKVALNTIKQRQTKLAKFS